MWAIDIIKELLSKNFYGKLTISFEKGRVTLVRKEETLKEV